MRRLAWWLFPMSAQAHDGHVHGALDGPLHHLVAPLLVVAIVALAVIARAAELHAEVAEPERDVECTVTSIGEHERHRVAEESGVFDRPHAALVSRDREQALARRDVECRHHPPESACIT